MVGRKTLLRKLGERRLAEGFTQIQTAKAIGISATCLSQFVTGKRRTQQAALSKINDWVRTSNGHAVIRGKASSVVDATVIDRTLFNAINGLNVSAENKMDVFNQLLG